MKICVTGAGGFLGGHLVNRLAAEGHQVRAVDIKPLHIWYQRAGFKNYTADLQLEESCRRAVDGMDQVYNLAADMGGMGFIETHRFDCSLSILITANMLKAARDAGVKKFFQASSACIYNTTKQLDPNVTALKESDAYPPNPEPGYGEEKFYGEQMCHYLTEDYGLPTRVARYHNVFGPLGTFEGGREKVPAAICRKVIMAKRSSSNEIEIWGDGSQTRSFMYVDDCIEGTRRIMNSDCSEPLNLGSDRLVTINELVDIVCEISGTNPKRVYNLDAPQGVRGRNSDNTLIRETLGWEPSITLEDGLERTYAWIYDQMTK